MPASAALNPAPSAERRIPAPCGERAASISLRSRGRLLGVEADRTCPAAADLPCRRGYPAAQIMVQPQPRTMANPGPCPPAQAVERSPDARRRLLCRRACGPGLVCLVLASMALAGGPALASSPEAWSAYDRQVRTACQAASGLAAVRVKGQRVDLPSLGLSALLLEGTYPQPHMGGRKGLELCLLEQRSGRASVAEADRLIGPAASPLPGQASSSSALH